MWSLKPKVLPAVMMACLLIIAPINTFAQDYSSGISDGLGFRFLGGAKVARANIGATDETILKKRPLNGIGLDAIAALQWDFLLFGAGFDFNKWFQAKDPADLNNTNLNGTSRNISAVFGAHLFSTFYLLGQYHVSSTYSLDKVDTAGRKIKYSSPDQSIAVALIVPSDSTYWGLEYSSSTFEEQDVGGTVSKLSGSNNINLTAVELKYGFIF